MFTTFSEAALIAISVFIGGCVALLCFTGVLALAGQLAEKACGF